MDSNGDKIFGIYCATVFASCFYHRSIGKAEMPTTSQVRVSCENWAADDQRSSLIFTTSPDVSCLIGGTNQLDVQKIKVSWSQISTSDGSNRQWSFSASAHSENNIAEVWLETSTVQMLEYVATFKKNNYSTWCLETSTLHTHIRSTYSKPWAPLRKHFSRQACHAGNAMLIPRQTFPEELVGIKENPKASRRTQKIRVQGLPWWCGFPINHVNHLITCQLDCKHRLITIVVILEILIFHTCLATRHGINKMTQKDTNEAVLCWQGKKPSNSIPQSHIDFHAQKTS